LGTIPPLPLVTNINNVNYYNGFIAFAFAGYGVDRNTGIFWEPGIFSSFLILALVFVILDSPVKRKRFSVAIDVILFAIGIVTTNSTAGYLLFFLCFDSIFFPKSVYNSWNGCRSYGRIGTFLCHVN